MRELFLIQMRNQRSDGGFFSLHRLRESCDLSLRGKLIKHGLDASPPHLQETNSKHSQEENDSFKKTTTRDVKLRHIRRCSGQAERQQQICDYLCDYEVAYKHKTRNFWRVSFSVSDLRLSGRRRRSSCAPPSSAAHPRSSSSRPGLCWFSPCGPHTRRAAYRRGARPRSPLRPSSGSR